MFFVDESIQHSLGYICVGFVYCKDAPDEHIAAALRKARLTPGESEYKSGGRMATSPELHLLRREISEIVLDHCKLGVYIAPTSERQVLLAGTVAAARSMVITNGLPAPQPLYVDQGITGEPEPHPNDPIELRSGCDSKAVLGIQLADYAAYHCSYLLKCALEGSSKVVRVESVPHPMSDEDVDLAWMIRTATRRNFFTECRDPRTIDGDDWFFRVAGFGSFLSSGLSEHHRQLAKKTFDEMYLGCVW